MRHLRRLGHSVAAGAVAGAALAPLQLLLWPEVVLPPLKIALAFAAWTSWGALWIGGALFALTEVAGVFMPYLGASRGVSIGLWRWLMTVVAFLGAVAAWWNREETRDLLLKDNRHALAWAGSVATLFWISFLVQAIRRRPRHHALARAAVSAGVLVGWLWGIWAVAPRLTSEAATVEPPRFAPAHRLLFVSWEGADLPWLLPAMERGDMPFLHACWDGGAWGQLRTVHPYTRSATLATLVTGCAPAVHGILGRSSYRIPWLTPGPVTLLLVGPWPAPHQLPWWGWRRTPELAPQRATLWQILMATGRKVGLVGWPSYAHGTWTVPRPSTAQAVRAAALDSDLKASLEPALRADSRLAADTRGSFGLAAAIGAAAQRRAGAHPVDALAVDFELAAHLRPRWTAEEPGSPEDVLHLAAHLLDEQLRTLWLLMGEDTLLVVVSPYGLAPPSPWQRLIHLGTPLRRWHVTPTDSPDGFVFFYGPGVRPGARLRGGRLADVTSTVLYLLELPVARDMAGRVMLEAVTDERAATVPLRLVPSYPAPDGGASRPAATAP
jgi:hypothetical protein